MKNKNTFCLNKNVLKMCTCIQRLRKTVNWTFSLKWFIYFFKPYETNINTGSTFLKNWHLFQWHHMCNHWITCRLLKYIIFVVSAAKSLVVSPQIKGYIQLFQCNSAPNDLTYMYTHIHPSFNTQQPWWIPSTVEHGLRDALRWLRAADS